ncbi:MAG: sodium-dependent transporter, partial [Muribaculaceae bacterium]|nr:sodium-dependent transporter [Muribaculaceae bacterium]
MTRTGVIAATVGSAVGLGNIWRFPYEAGMNGGGAFLLIYVICVFAVGVPVMLAEFVLGRGTHRGGAGAIAAISGKRFFKSVPIIGILASVLILSFYSVVAGWILEYLYWSVTQLFDPQVVDDYSARFGGFVANPVRTVGWTVLFLVLNFLVIVRGVEKGIERMSNILMPLLFLILVMFCVNSLMMPGAAEGLDFLFNPDFTKLSPSMVIDAMGQAFFSLSLGMTCLLTYASYFNDETPLLKSAVTVSVLDTLVAVLAGVVIFPAVFTYGMTPEAGSKLVFEILPAMFVQMPGGAVWAIFFFVLLFFAAITSTISMCEIPTAFFIENCKMKRRGAAAVVIGGLLVLSTLCALSFGPLSGVTMYGKTIFDLFDYVSSNILLPIGGIIVSIFVGWVVDRKFLNHQLSINNRCPQWLLTLLRIAMRWLA